MKTISFLLYDDILATSLILPIEMWKAAADFEKAARRDGTLSIQFIAESNRDYMTRAGLPLKPDCTPSRAQKSDLLYLPALWRNPLKAVKTNRRLLRWLLEKNDGITPLLAAGTGVCLLAETGLLDHKPATTHWYFFDRFEANYPDVRLKRQFFITKAGNLYCTGSINALADLTVHFIRQFYGDACASHVARHFSHEIRQSYEETTFLDEDPRRHHDEDIIQIQLWLHENYHRQLELSKLAEKFGMSTRSFNRRFKLATNKSPLTYLQDIRLASARDLLKNSNLNITEVAFRVGYNDIGHFNRLFRKRFQLRPGEFRKTVRSKLFSIE